VLSVDLRVDVTEVAGLGEPATVALTVTVPDAVPERPVVCFAKPGGGYGRRYFTEDLPGPGLGAQASWHADRGWVFVAVDHLGVGDSSTDHDGDRLTFSALVGASHAAESEVLARLAAGTLVDGLPPIVDPLTIGIGQSMGGCLTIVQQGRHHAYDGIAVLGFSPLHTEPPMAPGSPRFLMPWVPRDVAPSAGVWTNGPALAAVDPDDVAGPEAMAWGFHWDDVDPAVVERDLHDFPFRSGDLPPWASATVPVAASLWCLAPGSSLAEAAGIRVPVLVGMGERDVLVEPRGEGRAYLSSPSVDWFRCPRMAHMHNFAGTRELLWRRLETWVEWVRVLKEA
jgi:alpha-beta hydrolase superfamily lysophospholipase